MFDDHLVERGVIAVGDQRLCLFLVEGARLRQQPQECAPAVVKVRQPVFDFRRPKRMYVEAHVLAALAVAVAFERAHLIERHAQIRTAKRFVLVEFQTVLVVEVQRPQLSERHRNQFRPPDRGPREWRGRIR